MRAPVEWLADYVDIDLPVEQLAEKLTMTGLKVESIERIGSDWQDVIIGEVLEIEPHPDSRNPLWVAEVGLGHGRKATVVTGAQNVKRGHRVPVVQVGGILPHGPDGEPLVIERKSMAGITSNGMLVSERELGISDEHSGILILPPDAPVGEPLRTLLGGDVIDMETNANRPDTLSIVGIAREVAAMTRQQVSQPDVEAITGNVEWLERESIDLDVRAPDLCPRFSAIRITGVQATESPLWLAERLRAAGMRPINLLVDLTNYVMLEVGQPMHAFDAGRLAGGTIIVRRAREDEQVRTLDGVQRRLSGETCVIADGERVVGIAGVMGGENSEISSETTDMVLEAANWDPISIRRTAKALELRTEASLRFEKGLPPEQTVLALMRYLQLLVQTSPGPLRVSKITDLWSGRPGVRHVTMPMRDVHRLTGVEVPAEQAAESLSLLGFGVAQNNGTIVAEVPYWRRADIELSADLVEEVIRIVGYHEVPITLPLRTMPPLPLPRDLAWERLVAERLLGFGLSEATTHAMTSPAFMARLFASTPPSVDFESADLWSEIVPNPEGIAERGAATLPLRLANPATLDRQVMRLTLVPSLLDVLSRNLRQTDERVAFFEIARTYFERGGDLPYERRTLAIALAGLRQPTSWDGQAPGPYGFYDLKGILQSLLQAMEIKDWEIKPAAHPSLHPGRSAALGIASHRVAWFGELHPAVREHFELGPRPVQVAEVDLDGLVPLASSQHVFRSLPRFPAAKRDVAVVVAGGVPAGQVVEIIERMAGPILESARIFDVYRGQNIPEGHKSIAVSLSFRSLEATLTEDEVSLAMRRIVDGLRAEVEGALRE